MRAVPSGASATPCSALLAFPDHARGLPGYLSRHGWRRVQTLEVPGGAGQAVTAFGGADLERRMGG